MTEVAPKLSVLMTAYNREDYISEAIESVLASSYTDYELIIVDDCSNDATFDIANDYASRDKRLRVYKNDANLGDYPNRNKAAALARGKYLKYLDSDDVVYPHGLGVMVAYMERYPNAGFGLSAYAFEDRPHPVLLEPDEIYTTHFGGHDLLGRAPGSSIIRRTVFEQEDGFSGLRQVGDYEFWLKISMRHALVTLPRDLVWDSTHGNQEKTLDSPAAKAAMREQVTITAFADQFCPLAPIEGEVALKRLRKGHVRSFWKLALRPHRFSEALSYKKDIGLSWPMLINYAVSKWLTGG
jgi:glycosyltransferase involved in cell wall biosynthesis